MTNDAQPMTNDFTKTQMGTIIADSSHFTAFIEMSCSARLRLYDRLSFPDFRLSASDQKLLPWSFFPDVLPPGFQTVRCPSLEIASSGSFGGRSALLILVRVALLLPSDDEPVSAFALPGPGKYAAVAEASGSTLRRQAQLSKEHLAVAGAGRLPSVLPSVTGSGPSGSQAFTCLVRTSSHLRSVFFPLLSGLPFIAHLV